MSAPALPAVYAFLATSKRFYIACKLCHSPRQLYSSYLHAMCRVMLTLLDKCMLCCLSRRTIDELSISNRIYAACTCFYPSFHRTRFIFIPLKGQLHHILSLVTASGKNHLRTSSVFPISLRCTSHHIIWIGWALLGFGFCFKITRQQSEFCVQRMRLLLVLATTTNKYFSAAMQNTRFPSDNKRIEEALLLPPM